MKSATIQCRSLLAIAAAWSCLARSGGAQEPAAAIPEQPVVIGHSAAASRVPDAWRQGTFLEPQSVSALDISADGTRVGVATMAFRHDRNFWLLSGEGKILWNRYAEPWAPFQTAVLAGGKTCAVALVYSHVMEPSPTISIFQADRGPETVLADIFWNMGYMRYGSGDWRTGWPASLVGDLMVRAGDSLFTVSAPDGARRFAGDGSSQPFPLADQRPFRLAASADGRVLALCYLSPDVRTLDEKTRGRLHLPPAMLVARNALTSAQIWAVAADAETAAAPKPPEAADDFPELAADFNIQPLALVPARAPLSVAVNGDGSTVAVAEYGGWLRVKRERGIGRWNPDHPVSFCPRQRGRLRVLGARGETLAEADFPADGLFELHLDREAATVWCAPQAWFARGMAGKSWLPSDPDARRVFAFDLGRKAWRPAWQFPDAVSDLALAPDGRQVLVSCWDGHAYLLDTAGQVQASVDVGDAARVQWSADGRFAVAGTQRGDVWSLDARGQVRWHTVLPAAELPPPTEAAKPVYPDVPIYQVGRTGKEEAYVGDMWLIKSDSGALMVDCGASSAIPITWQRMRAAGVEPKQLRYILLSHTHGDHVGAAYLWRTLGAKIVAPESAALAAGWLMPIWSDYGIWAPARIDMPLRLKRPGDEVDFTLANLKIKAVFVPGHAFDSVIYLIDVGGKRVAFTGDIGFPGDANIVHRAWGDALKGQATMQVVRDKVLPWRPDYVFAGHGSFQAGTAFLEGLVERSEAALQAQP